MKNYLFMNTATKNKKNITNNNTSPKKIKTLAGVHFSTKASTKTLGVQMHSSIKRSTDKYNLCATTRSIDQINCNSSVENEQTNPIISLDSKNHEELFSRSYMMIAKIKQSYPFKTIDKELNEVLNMLKEQKIKISEKIKTLKKSNQYYKQICADTNKETMVEREINTEGVVQERTIIEYKDAEVTCEIQQQTEINETIQKPEKTQKTKDIYNSEAYMKLSKMLQEMNINPKNILPYEDNSDAVTVTDYKTLSDRQIIKIQRFFIKKLVQKMPK